MRGRWLLFDVTKSMNFTGISAWCTKRCERGALDCYVEVTFCIKRTSQDTHMLGLKILSCSCRDYVGCLTSDCMWKAKVGYLGFFSEFMNIRMILISPT